MTTIESHKTEQKEIDQTAVPSFSIDSNGTSICITEEIQ
jgi:hypothetical protein